MGEALDGADALKIAHDLQPDVILMDLMMPIMDGITAIGALRRDLPDMEVIALTSVLEDGAVVNAMRAGAIGYLLKDTQRRNCSAPSKPPPTDRFSFRPRQRPICCAKCRRPTARNSSPTAKRMCCDCWRRVSPIRKSLWS